MSATAAPTPVILADVLPLPRARARSVLLVCLFATATAIGAQIGVDLDATPVPLNSQTLFVLLSGAVLGARLGAASQLLYFGAAATGLPVLSGGDSGWGTATGWQFGYLVGFIAAAGVVGALAERQKDRSFHTAVLAMLAGTAIFYVFGVTWLAHWSGIPLYDPAAPTDGFRQAVRPVLATDLAKLVTAAAVVPLAWKAHERGATTVASPADRRAAQPGSRRP